MANRPKTKQLTSISDFEKIAQGTPIRVTDNNPEPPKHHKKRHREWAMSNYVGYFHAAEYSAGRFEIRIATSLTGMLVQCYGAGGRHQFSLV
jgi:hypothetical protein